MPRISLLHQACKGVEGCGICIFMCPKGLFCDSRDMNEAGYLLPQIKNESECSGCMNCMIFCPDFAVVIEKDPKGESAEGECGDE